MYGFEMNSDNPTKFVGCKCIGKSELTIIDKITIIANPKLKGFTKRFVSRCKYDI